MSSHRGSPRVRTGRPGRPGRDSSAAASSRARWIPTHRWMPRPKLSWPAASRRTSNRSGSGNRTRRGWPSRTSPAPRAGGERHAGQPMSSVTYRVKNWTGAWSRRTSLNAAGINVGSARTASHWSGGGRTAGRPWPGRSPWCRSRARCRRRCSRPAHAAEVLAPAAGASSPRSSASSARWRSSASAPNPSAARGPTGPNRLNARSASPGYASRPPRRARPGRPRPSGCTGGPGRPRVEGSGAGRPPRRSPPPWPHVRREGVDRRRESWSASGLR